MASKILILSVTTGSGHVQAANAVAEHATRYFPGVSVISKDITSLLSKTDRFIHRGLYHFLSRHGKILWDFFYSFTNSKLVSRLFSFFGEKFSGQETALFSMLNAENPDYILCTYVGCLALIRPWLKAQSKQIPISIVVTDYHAHASYALYKLHRYFVPTPSVKAELSMHGVETRRIVVSGIPLKESFYQKHDAHIAKESPLKVVLMSGGQGFDNLCRVIAMLSEYPHSLTITAIAGSNTRLYAKLKNMRTPKHISLNVYGWVNDVAALFANASAVITKPGALAVTECFALGVPLICMGRGAGQEKYNAHYAQTAYGAAIVKNKKELFIALSQALCVKPEQIVQKPPAAETILTTICRSL